MRLKRFMKMLVSVASLQIINFALINKYVELMRVLLKIIGLVNP